MTNRTTYTRREFSCAALAAMASITIVPRHVVAGSGQRAPATS